MYVYKAGLRMCENVFLHWLVPSLTSHSRLLLTSDSHSDCVWSPGHKSGCPVPQEPHTTTKSLCAQVRGSSPCLLHGQTRRISPGIDRLPQQTEMRCAEEEDAVERYKQDEEKFEIRTLSCG